MDTVKIVKTKKRQVSMFRLIILFFAIIVIGRSVYTLVTKNAKTDIVKYGGIENFEVTSGIVIKNETIAYSPAPGKIKSLVPEGTKVKKGVNVASIIKDDSALQISDKMNKLDNQVSQLKASSTQNSELFKQDIDKLQTKINENIMSIRDMRSNSNIEKTADIKAQLNELINKVQNMPGQSADSNIQSKINEKENYQSLLNNAKLDIPSSAPGIVSYKIDGLEKLLSVSGIKSITLDDINKIEVKGKSEAQNNTQTGQPLFKIIDNFEWYIISVIKTNKLDPLKENKEISVSINNEAAIPAKVYSIRDGGSGNSIVTLQLNSNLELYYSARKVSLKIIKQNIEGIKIPISSLINKDGKRGVLLVDKGITKFKEVDVKGFDKKYAIIEVENQFSDKNGLALYSEIVTNPSFIQDGVIINR